MAIIERNIRSLQSNLKANLTYIDILYKGYVEGKESIVKDGNAIVNQYKIWLQSGSKDYHRNYGHGGFCEGNLNRYAFAESSEPLIGAELRTLTEEKFPYIEMLDCSVKCSVQKKAWIIKARIRDRITGLIGDLTDSGMVVTVDE